MGFKKRFFTEAIQKILSNPQGQKTQEAHKKQAPQRNHRKSSCRYLQNVRRRNKPARRKFHIRRPRFQAPGRSRQTRDRMTDSYIVRKSYK